MKKAAARLIKRAERARVDPSAFFTFAAREEHTRERIAALPHQRLLLDFVTAHRTSLVRAFVGSSKTFTLGWLGLHLLGNDRTGRGAILGSTADSASKVLSVIRDAVEDPRREFAEVHLTFPTLQRGQGSSDSWTKTRLTVERPGGIRDPSWIAMGTSGALPGARLKWIIVDDILDEKNTATPAARAKLNRNFGRKILTRLDMRDAHIVVLNTPWEPDDLTFELEKAGWPTLSMEVEGEVLVSGTEWTSDLLRPSRVRPGAWRLAAHDSAAYDAALCELRVDGQRYPLAEGEEAQPGSIVEHFDLDDRVPLWPEKFGVEQIEQIRKDFAATPGEFMAKYKLRPRAPADEGKKRKWIAECKANGRALGYTALATGYRGPNPTFTGVDVATAVEEGADLRAIFTFEQIDALDLRLPDGRVRRLRNARKLLNVTSGLWAGAEFVDRIEDEARRFNSMVRVETNAAQDLLRQWLIQRDSALSVYAHVTGGANKSARITGVAGVLIELENLAWIFPCGEDGRSPEEVEAWFAELLDYRPDRHPGDRLIASWLARAQCRAVLGDAAIPVDLATIAERFR